MADLKKIIDEIEEALQNNCDYSVAIKILERVQKETLADVQKLDELSEERFSKYKENKELYSRWVEERRDHCFLAGWGSNMISIVFFYAGFKQGQKETLEARLEWPTWETILKAAGSHAEYDAQLGALNKMSFFETIQWLRDNVRLAPKEQVSDVEIKKSMVEHRHKWRAFSTDALGGCQQTPDDVYAEAYEDGYRAAEKKAREE